MSAYVEEVCKRAESVGCQFKVNRLGSNKAVYIDDKNAPLDPQLFLDMPGVEDVYTITANPPVDEAIAVGAS